MYGTNVKKKKLETAGFADALATINEATRCHNPQKHSHNKYSPM